VAHALILVVSGPIERGSIPELCARVDGILQQNNADLILCDLSAVARPSVATVDALARLQLVARRLGCGLRLVHPCRELRDLLALSGMDQVLPVAEVLRVEPRRQAEQREQRRGVQEEGDRAEPIA
jgi:ABC-type transporter Mla MlaB component